MELGLQSSLLTYLLRGPIKCKKANSQAMKFRLEGSFLQAADKNFQAAERVVQTIKEAGGEATACEYDICLYWKSHSILLQVVSLLGQCCI